MMSSALPSSLMPTVQVLGTGSYLPPRRVTNADLVVQLSKNGIETSDEWIAERTGIQARYFTDPGMSTSQMATAAARQALEAAQCDPHEIDLILVATTTPDMVFPSTACLVQSQLGIRGGAAFDVQAVCTGFIYALSTAWSMLSTGMARKALVIGAEEFSRLLDFKDRTTCVLFGDGAGAVVLEATASPVGGARGFRACKLHADGHHASILCTPGTLKAGQVSGSPLVVMDGQAVFKLAVNVLESVAREVLEHAACSAAEVDWLIPHQANIRIIQSTARKLQLPMDKVIVTVDQHGNTSAASIPLAFDYGVRSGKIQRGHTLLLEGVGGGFTWGAVLLDY
jgi:3-oxoacyl-[acyl-carrier-protein] synthase III